MRLRENLQYKYTGRIPREGWEIAFSRWVYEDFHGREAYEGGFLNWMYLNFTDDEVDTYYMRWMSATGGEYAAEE